MNSVPPTSKTDGIAGWLDQYLDPALFLSPNTLQDISTLDPNQALASIEDSGIVSKTSDAQHASQISLQAPDHQTGSRLGQRESPDPAMHLPPSMDHRQSPSQYTVQPKDVHEPSISQELAGYGVGFPTSLDSATVRMIFDNESFYPSHGGNGNSQGHSMPSMPSVTAPSVTVPYTSLHDMHAPLLPALLDPETPLDPVLNLDLWSQYPLPISLEQLPPPEPLKVIPSYDRSASLPPLGPLPFRDPSSPNLISQTAAYKKAPIPRLQTPPKNPKAQPPSTQTQTLQKQTQKVSQKLPKPLTTNQHQPALQVDPQSRPKRRPSPISPNQRKKQRVPRSPYTPLSEAPAAWGLIGQPRLFRYTLEGEWTHSIRLTGSQTREYISACIRHPQKQFRIWIQKTPAQYAHRYPHPLSGKCRWARCPAARGTILKGFFRVAFDEHADATGVDVDPFHNAGYMHLHCFEKIVDIAALCRAGVVVLDTRKLAREERNPMAVTCDHEELRDTFTTWLQERSHAFQYPRLAMRFYSDQAGALARNSNEMQKLEAAVSPSEDESSEAVRLRPSVFLTREARLWYRLTKRHVDLDGAGRQLIRESRGGNSIDKHVGDLDVFVEKERQKKEHFIKDEKASRAQTDHTLTSHTLDQLSKDVTSRGPRAQVQLSQGQPSQGYPSHGQLSQDQPSLYQLPQGYGSRGPSQGTQWSGYPSLGMYPPATYPPSLQGSASAANFVNAPGPVTVSGPVNIPSSANIHGPSHDPVSIPVPSALSDMAYWYSYPTFWPYQALGQKQDVDTLGLAGPSTEAFPCQFFGNIYPYEYQAPAQALRQTPSQAPTPPHVPFHGHPQDSPSQAKRQRDSYEEPLPQNPTRKDESGMTTRSGRKTKKPRYK